MYQGTAGLYYYVGIILRVLYKEGRYSRDEITSVYFGGYGSRSLSWLAEGGEFNEDSVINRLLSRMLSKGSGFEDIEEITHLSRNPQDEVACGLILNNTPLQGLKDNQQDQPIAGETCLINRAEIAWDERLSDDEEIADFSVTQLNTLQQFLDEFNIAIKKLDIKELKPLKGYKLSPNPEENNKLWRNTTKELKSTLPKIKGHSENIRVEPPFIFALKTLLKVLGKEWAGKS